MAEIRNLQAPQGHQGRRISEVGPRQQHRHIKELREKAQKALWFAETYGLTLKTLHIEDRTGCQINVNLGQASRSANAASSSEGGEVGKSKPSYEMLEKEQKEKNRNHFVHYGSFFDINESLP